MKINAPRPICLYMKRVEQYFNILNDASIVPKDSMPLFDYSNYPIDAQSNIASITHKKKNLPFYNRKFKKEKRSSLLSFSKTDSNKTSTVKNVEKHFQYLLNLLFQYELLLIKMLIFYMIIRSKKWP